MAPHITLEELGLPFETVRVALAEGAHRRPEYLAINPRARVPALVVDGIVLTEVPALLVYLASQKPEAGLLPLAGTTEFARCLEWLSWITSSHHVQLAHYWVPLRYVPEDAPLDAIREQGRRNFDLGTQEIEERLVGPWALGDNYSVADPYLLFCYRQGNRVGLPMAERYPRFTAWAERMLTRPAVQRVMEREGITIDGN